MTALRACQVHQHMFRIPNVITDERARSFNKSKSREDCTGRDQVTHKSCADIPRFSVSAFRTPDSDTASYSPLGMLHLLFALLSVTQQVVRQPLCRFDLHAIPFCGHSTISTGKQRRS